MPSPHKHNTSDQLVRQADSVPHQLPLLPADSVRPHRLDSHPRLDKQRRSQPLPSGKPLHSEQAVRGDSEAQLVRQLASAQQQALAAGLEL